MSHQNAAKRLKALLRRTHFPVARLKQIPGATGPGGPGQGEGGGGGGAGFNPWDGIVTGEPRAALIVLHWTLLDMSPLFSSLLLGRGYVGLQSLTDFKFVSRCLRMLRDEFNLRPQLTAEQFLTSGFAEVKMRLLAEVVELVMRTHHSLAQHGGDNTCNGSTSNSASFSAAGAGSNALISGGGGWGIKSDNSGGSGTSSPWTAPTPSPRNQQQYSRPGSVESRGSAGGFSSMSPGPPQQPRSPPLLCGGPIGGGAGTSGGGGSNNNGVIVRHPAAYSPSGMSDEQNAPPAGLSQHHHHRRMGPNSCNPQRLVPASVHAPVPLHRDGNNTNGGDHRAFYNNAGGGGAGSSPWVVRGPGNSDGSRIGGGGGRRGAPQPLQPSGGRSPLGLRSAQGPDDDERMTSADLEVAAAGMGMLPPPLQCPPLQSGSGIGAVSSAGKVGGGTGGGGRSDWRAVQQAFGSPSALHMPLPPAVVVPSSPPGISPMPKLPPRSSTSVAVAVAAAHAASVGGGRGRRTQEAFFPVNGADRSGGVVTPVGTGGAFGGNDSGPSPAGGERGMDGGHISGRHRRRRPQQEYDDEVSLTAELGKMQRQIEAMLERHSRSLEGRLSETEQTLSARLTLLETKVHGLEIGSPLRM